MGERRMLKADLHVHTCEDPYDSPKHSAYTLVEEAAAKGFEVLSITNHRRVTFSSRLQHFAEERGVLLLPGTEACVEKAHVLLINIDPEIDPKSIRTFTDLKRLRSEETLIIAPHPFYPSGESLGKKLERHLSLFDAVEYSFFYTKRIDFNKRAVRIAQTRGLPLLGTSDCHSLSQFGIAYSWIESEKTPSGVVRAVKRGRVKPETRPLTLREFFLFGIELILVSGKRNFLRKKSFKEKEKMEPPYPLEKGSPEPLPFALSARTLSENDPDWNLPERKPLP